MKVTIATAGSRGDVQPYVALGVGLARRGHDVVVATHAPFEAFVRGRGLGFKPLFGDPIALVQAEAGLGWLESGGNALHFVQRLGQIIRPMMDPMIRSMLDSVDGAEAVVFAPLTFPCYDFALARGLPAMMAAPIPLSATRDFPFPLFPDLGLPGDLNWLSHQLALHTASFGLAGELNRWRREVGLGPLPFGGFSLKRQDDLGVLYGFSPHVIPRPADWGPQLHVTGHWHLAEPEGWTPPDALAAFLDAGPPPVYVGFGSMAGRDPAGLTAKVVEALRLAGRRGVVLSGWGGLGRDGVPDDVLVVDDVPHGWLFPRMAAVVHHGGAGTTAAAMRAGVPAVVAPYFADQPFWGERVRALGVGPAPVPQQTLTAENLARAIRRAVEDPAIAERAASLGGKLRAEDGVAAACDAFERVAGIR